MGPFCQGIETAAQTLTLFENEPLQFRQPCIEPLQARVDFLQAGVHARETGDDSGEAAFQIVIVHVCQRRQSACHRSGMVLPPDSIARRT